MDICITSGWFVSEVIATVYHYESVAVNRNSSPNQWAWQTSRVRPKPLHQQNRNDVHRVKCYTECSQLIVVTGIESGYMYWFLHS